MLRRTFRVPYSVIELDAGVTMAYHPVSGRKLRSLTYCDSCHQFYTLSTSLSLWAFHLQDDTPVYQDRISRGKQVDAGDPYPAHWKFDPFIGAPIDA